MLSRKQIHCANETPELQANLEKDRHEMQSQLTLLEIAISLETLAFQARRLKVERDWHVRLKELELSKQQVHAEQEYKKQQTIRQRQVWNEPQVRENLRVLEKRICKLRAQMITQTNGTDEMRIISEVHLYEEEADELRTCLKQQQTGGEQVAEEQMARVIENQSLTEEESTIGHSEMSLDELPPSWTEMRAKMYTEKQDELLAEVQAKMMTEMQIMQQTMQQLDMRQLDVRQQVTRVDAQAKVLYQIHAMLQAMIPRDILPSEDKLLSEMRAKVQTMLETEIQAMPSGDKLLSEMWTKTQTMLKAGI